MHLCSVHCNAFLIKLLQRLLSNYRVQRFFPEMLVDITFRIKMCNIIITSNKNIW